VVFCVELSVGVEGAESMVGKASGDLEWEYGLSSGKEGIRHTRRLLSRFGI